MAGETYWRCKWCNIVHATYVCEHLQQECCGVPMEPVAVLPVAELAALRAREIDWERYNMLDSEVEALRRLRDRVASEAFLDDFLAGLDDVLYEDDHIHEAIDAYRAALGATP